MLLPQAERAMCAGSDCVLCTSAGCRGNLGCVCCAGSCRLREPCVRKMDVCPAHEGGVDVWCACKAAGMRLVPTTLHIPRSSSMLSCVREMDVCFAHQAGVDVCSDRKAPGMCLLPTMLQVAGSQRAQQAGAVRDPEQQAAHMLSKQLMWLPGKRSRAACTCSMRSLPCAPAVPPCAVSLGV